MENDDLWDADTDLKHLWFQFLLVDGDDVKFSAEDEYSIPWRTFKTNQKRSWWSAGALGA